MIVISCCSLSSCCCCSRSARSSPAQGGGDEPALRRRRLRRRDVRLPEGLGRSSSGSTHAVPIVSYVPLLMFAILFGLSMDYEVFLMSQIQEHYQETATPAGGRRRTRGDGRVITSAALIMVFVFCELRPERRPDGQAVRRRAGGRDRGRRDRRALPARAGGDGADGQAPPGGCRAGSTASCRTSASRARATSTTPRRRRRPSPNRRPPLRRTFCQIESPPRPRRLAATQPPTKESR